ncbi:nickel-dependent hydrogenase large subunit [Paramagnetospirillum magneticum]|uniref:Ni,Fe-hydrogenase I large subunit n=1 Tax=Paramagnetospirillum magneticum (strain ATCC 700264 / AMB-1) TaxID=342108 RepID=Q2W8A7_PARM1|nr:nickel-dependent hydrogenase large subunit [Paramagnetospirillum magneticum]BAE49918.1 Ni,Fe-hydrogenase I large subunit [Paramagnetospirillum magneticum AMB-1]
MAVRKILDVPVNRVEGDLELRLEIADGMVVDAWSAGTMFRGFERLLIGRGALDGLVVTPRICGICSTTHLMTAAKALDAVAGAKVPDNGVRLRNLALMAEHVQSDVRQGILMFLVDFANPAYRAQPLYDEAVRRYAPLAGEAVAEAVRETKHVVEIIAIIGGQWPHSSFMVPGGLSYAPPVAELLQCRHVLDGFRGWYERRILGCSLDRWRAVDSLEALDLWLEESAAHRDSDVGFLLRFGRTIGLDRLGGGHGNFLSCGSLDLPAETAARGVGGHLVPSGFARGAVVEGFDPAAIAEHVAASWYAAYEGGRHPAEGETEPYASGEEGRRYSWVKAARYLGTPAETGPFAERIVAGDPLFTDLLRRQGPNALARELARLTRPATLLPAMALWLGEVIASGGHDIYADPGPIPDGAGIGMIQAARGALGHWIAIKDGRIERYQIITPTVWNGSPRDSGGVRGPWEEALIGTPVADADNPVEVGHVIRSFDPCLVCSVHTVRKGRSLGRVRLEA